MIEELAKICEIRFGSHLYGTATAESDQDFKGVYLPTLDDMLLGRVKKSVESATKASAGEGVKNTPDDVDRQFYSLQYFIKLLCEGQTVALDMVHAGPEHHVWPPLTECWMDLLANRHRAYSRNLKAFMGYARRQAAKYGLKGSRLHDAERILTVIETALCVWEDGSHSVRSIGPDARVPPPEPRLDDIWDILPGLVHGKKIPAGDARSPDGLAYYEICGIMLQGRARLSTVREPVANFLKKYGERARQAARNEGVDWKAISHAFRAAFECRLILTEGGFSFPLDEAPFLLEVKQGKIPYPEIAPLLDETIDTVQQLADASGLPETVDTGWWDGWLTNWLRRLRT